MYRIAIVDDDFKATENLTSLLHRYEKEVGMTFEIKTYTNSESFLTDFKSDFNLLFLDIQLPHISGMEIAEKVREVDKTVGIIFETDFAQYALQGYKFDAIDYFVKPVTYESLKLRMTLLAEKSRFSPPTYYVAIKGGGRNLPISDILYVEQLGHHQIFHTKKEEIETSKRISLSDVEKEFKDHGFARCSSSYLVNLNNVTGIVNDDVIIGNIKLPISRGMKKEFSDKLLAILNTSSPSNK